MLHAFSSSSSVAEGSSLLSVIVPVYNEAATLETVLKQLLSLPLVELEVVVVDDASTDGSSAMIAAAAQADQRVRTIRLENNSGKTAAVRRGAAITRGRVIVIQDADLEYNPSEISRLIEPILHGQADVVYGSRFLGRSSRGSWPFRHYWGNRLCTFFSNRFTRWSISDVETCYKAFRAPILKQLDLTSRRFGMEIEVTALASMTQARFIELPITYAPRNKASGKKIRFADGLWAIYYIFYYNAVARWFFDTRRYVESVNAALGKSTDDADDTAGNSSDALTTTPFSS
jgi:glycosyltransferase involved in cell wall biosynthesis